jgi:hypothetical protein
VNIVVQCIRWLCSAWRCRREKQNREYRIQLRICRMYTGRFLKAQAAVVSRYYSYSAGIWTDNTHGLRSLYPSLFPATPKAFFSTHDWRRWDGRVERIPSNHTLLLVRMNLRPPLPPGQGGMERPAEGILSNIFRFVFLVHPPVSKPISATTL